MVLQTGAVGTLGHCLSHLLPQHRINFTKNFLYRSLLSAFFLNPEEWRVLTLPEQPIPGLNHSHTKKMSLNVYPELPLLQFELATFCSNPHG